MERDERKPIAGMKCIECAKAGDDTVFLNIDTKWKPPEGIDPRMHRFACPKGHEMFRVLTRGAEIRLFELSGAKLRE